MSTKRPTHREDPKSEAEKILEMMYKQGKAQFGDAMKSFWFYDGDFCPGCLARPIDRMKFKGKDALSVNGYIYRPRGVLIGYFLCDVCANFIFKEAEKHPYKQTPLHADIERNLADAYLRYLSSLDA
jgi:hypothetical protein